MARLIYIANTTLDGYTEDREGNFDWTTPNEEGFSFITNLVRPIGTHVLGRRMYQTMMVWETDPTLAAQSRLRAEFAELWQAADKVVYSKTLEAVATRRTRIERTFDPEAIRQLKQRAGRDVLIGGPELAAHAFRAGLIDECHLFIAPIIIGGGKPALPDNLRLDLELLGQRRFDNGVVYLGYRTRQADAA
jgi:dihydrofolate reductase